MRREEKISLCKRVNACMLALIVLCGVLSPVCAYASSDFNYSIEDVYEAFATQPGDDAKNDDNGDAEAPKVGDYVLPTWAVLRKEVVDSDKALTLTGDAFEVAINRVNIAKAILSGYKNSSAWAKFKKDLESVCIYDKETQELIMKDETASTVRKFEAMLSEFDQAMLIASVSAMTDISKTSSNNKFTVVAGNTIDMIIGVIGVLAFEVGRLAMACMSFVTVCELMYIGIEPLRPILGFETQPKFFKKLTYRGEELASDSTRVFRLVGAAARSAVAKEYEINNNMSEVHKNNLLASYLFGKMGYLIAMFFGVAIIDSRLWGSICVGLMSAVMGLF